LPLSVICELLGLPLADRAKFTEWASGFTRFTGALGFLSMMPKIFSMRRYIEGHLETVRRQGGQGLIGEIVQVEKDGGRISREEIVSMVLLLLFAGHETTTHLIGGSVFELLKNPALRDWLEEDWGRADLAVEEFLRFVSPVQFSKPRFVKRDMELGGAALKRGDKIMAMVAAANMESRGQRASRAARACPPAKSSYGVRRRHPFLPRPSARAHRGDVRPGGAVHALAEAPIGGRPRRYPLAKAARPAIDRGIARGGGVERKRRSGDVERDAIRFNRIALYVFD